MVESVTLTGIYFLTQGMKTMLAPRVKGIINKTKKVLVPSGSTNYGYCQRCGKKLQGDRSKKLCYECWSK